MLELRMVYLEISVITHSELFEFLVQFPKSMYKQHTYSGWGGFSVFNTNLLFFVLSWRILPLVVGREGQSAVGGSVSLEFTSTGTLSAPAPSAHISSVGWAFCLMAGL